MRILIIQKVVKNRDNRNQSAIPIIVNKKCILYRVNYIYKRDISEKQQFHENIEIVF